MFDDEPFFKKSSQFDQEMQRPQTRPGYRKE